MTRLVTFADGQSSSSAPTTTSDSYTSPSNWPTLRPSLILDFANSRSLDPRITFTRSGATSTRINEKGLIELVGANIPRFDHDPVTLACKGLLIEESRVNLALRSEEFDNATWNKTSCTVSANATTGPDGTASFDKVIPDNAVSLTGAAIWQSYTKAASATTYTYSAFVKEAELDRVRLFVRDSASSANSATANFSLVNGALVGSVSVGGTFTAASASSALHINGIYRVWLTFTSGTETGIRTYLYALDSVATSGDGTSGIYAGCTQFEPGAFPSSYIPTTSSSVTRSADVVSMTGTNFSSWYRNDEGTLLTIARVPQIATTSVVASISDNTNNNRIHQQAYHVTPSVLSFVQTSGSTQVSIGTGTVSAGTQFVTALSYKENDYAASTNGSAASTDSSASVPTGMVNLRLLSSSTGATTYSGHIARFAFYPKRLTNAELQAVTT